MHTLGAVMRLDLEGFSLYFSNGLCGSVLNEREEGRRIVRLGLVD